MLSLKLYEGFIEVEKQYYNPKFERKKQFGGFNLSRSEGTWVYSRYRAIMMGKN